MHEIAFDFQGYQFWTKANETGQFSIDNVRAGEYNLYAWIPGFIGDYKHDESITIIPGFNYSVLPLIFNYFSLIIYI